MISSILLMISGLTLDEFTKICEDLKSREVSSTFKRSLSKRVDVDVLGGMSEASSGKTISTIEAKKN